MEEIQRQKDKPSGLGADWGRIPWDEWARHLKGAQTALDDLHQAVEASFATRASLGTLVEAMGGGIPSLIPRPSGSG